MASIEERFQAAVNVIKGLPKNGPYQPSTAMMLKFYGYYKQATEGPCQQRKPAFWDIVGKAKWDAWNSNRHLTKQQAMQKYVEDLREIIETMSFTENVQNFVGSISGLDNINLDELEMIAPGMREIAQSHPNSPFNSRTNSPQHGATPTGERECEELASAGGAPMMNGHAAHLMMNGDAEDADDASATTMSTSPAALQQVGVGEVDVTAATATAAAPTLHVAMTPIEQSDDEYYADPVDMQHELTEAMTGHTALLRQVQAAVLRMDADLALVQQRMGTLEQVMRGMQQAQRPATNRAGRSSSPPKWWPFAGISPGWFALLVLWPFVVQRVSRLLLAPPRRQ